jgi:gliding motility-associated-like protein
MCGDAMTQFRRQTSYQYLDFNSRSLSASTSATDGVPFTINFNEWAQFSRFDWSKVRLEKRFVVPKGVSLASPINMYWNGVTNVGSVGYTTQVSSGTTHDTISIFTTRMRGANNSDDNFSVDFINDCSLNTDTCSELVIEVSSFVHIDDGDINMPCYVSPIGCGSVSIIKDCNATHTGYNIVSQSLQRATFGWTDSSQTTRATANTPGVILNKVHPYDSIKLTAVLTTQDTAFNTLYFDVIYNHLTGTSDPISFLANASKASITDVSSGSTFRFQGLSVSKINTSATEHILRLNLSSLRDSMRIASGNSAFMFGGESGSSTYTNDTIKIEFYLYGNRLQDNQINTQLVAFEAISTKPSIPTCIYRGAEIEIDHEDERVSRRTDNYGWTGCSAPFYAIVGFSYLDAGSTNDPATSISPKFDPAEFKPYTEFDSVYLTWDESVYYLDTNELYYFTRYYYGWINFGATSNTLPLAKNRVKILSSNEVMVYTSGLPKRYALGARDHLQVALPFRNSCGRDLSSVSSGHPNGDQRFSHTLYRNLYPQAIGGSVSANVVSSFSSSTTTAQLPELQLNITTPTVNANRDTVSWNFSVRNTHLSEMTPYTWVDIQSPSSGINPVALTDGTSTYPLLAYANGFWAKIDTILVNSAKNLTLLADFTTCTDDSLIIRVGYSCSQYPTDPAQGYPSTGYVCNDLIESDFLYLKARKPLIQNLISSQPDSAIELCDTLSYVLFSQNSGEVNVKNLRQQLILPVSTLSVIPATSELEWPANSGTWISISDPVLTSGIYEWDLANQFKSGILEGASSPLDSNKFNIRFLIKTGCPFTSGDQLVFKLVASELCGANIASIPIAGKPIIIQGLPPSPTTVLTIDFEEDTVNACTNSSIGSVFITNAVGGPTSGQEKLIFQIDDTTINVQLPVFNLINSGYLTSLTPFDTIINNKRVLEWSLISNVPVGDSIGFDFNLISIDYKKTTCSEVPIRISTAEKHQILCASTSVLCDINFPISTTFDTLSIRKGDLQIGEISVTSNTCQDSVEVDFTLINSGVDIASNTTKVSFAKDGNNNGVLDSGDTYFAGQEFFVTDSIPYGDSISVTTKLFLDFEACDIFIVLDTSNCICSINDTLIPIDFQSNIDTLTLCTGLADSLPICSGSKHQLTRTYNWTGLNPSSSLGLLSSSSVLKPIFTSPTVTSTTTYIYELETTRSGCSSFDTIVVIVHPLPLAFTTTDTIVCPSATYSISPDSIESGIVYTVWDSPTGGTNLGVSPLNVSFVRDTSFYIQANNLTTGCELVPRTRISLFEDTLLPIISCANTTVYLNNLGSASVDTSLLLTSLFDNCGIDSVYLSATSFNCSNIGANTVTLFARDVNGNIDSCSAVVTVLDTLTPIISCTDTTIYLNNSGFATIDTSFVHVGSSDNCGIDSVYLSATSFNCSNIGANAVTLFARDVNGNIDSCSAVVTVLDTLTPIISCTDTTIYLNNSGFATIDTSFVLGNLSDNCDIDSIQLSNTDFTCADVGVNNVTVIAWDQSGNLDSCLTQVTVLDTTNPTVSCTDTTIFLGTGGTVSITNSFVLLSAQDVCGIDTTYLSQTSFTCSNIGSNIVTIFARDVNGNIDSCQSIVTVLDSTKPLVICTDTTVFLTNSGSVSIDTSFVHVSSSDNCGIDSVYLSRNSFNCLNVGTNSVQLYVKDSNGNIDSCSAIVTVRDTLLPSVSCLDTTIYLNNTGVANIDTSYVVGNVSDNCGIDSVYLSNSSFNCSNIGVNTIFLYAKDEHGNIDSCISQITVLDTIAPTFTCNDTLVFLNATGNFVLDTSYLLSNLLDNCGIDSVYLSRTNFDCTHIGVNQVTVYVQDDNGNIDSCLSLITIQDSLNPIITCKDTVVYLDATGQVSIDTSYLLTSLSDNCGIDSVFITSSTTFSCIDTGINRVTTYARDVNGNLDSCTSIVRVLDTLTPVITCRNTTLYLGNTGTAILDTSQVLTSISSNCVIDSVYLSQRIFSCTDTGANNVSIYARDRNGNIDSCSMTVTILDTIPPVIVCRDTVIYLSPLGAVSLDSTYVLSSFSDNCQVQRVTLSKKDFSCADTGVFVISILAFDPSGNVDSCQSRVSIIDTISPTAICQNTTIFLDQSGAATITTADINNGSFDNCGVQSLSLDKTLFGCNDIGSNTVVLTVTDRAGNTSTCSAVVTVIDNLDPIVTCPPIVIDTTLLNDCRFVVPDFSGRLNATDNCTPADSITYMQSPVPGTIIDYSNELNEVNTLNLSITATDRELNSTSCSFDLMIGCRVNVSVPQIFSPNGDGINDILYAFGRNFTSFEFVIYNRWGEKVFETNDPAIGWDGNYKGKPAQAGVYVFYLSSTTKQFGEITRKGDITLIR